MKFLLGFLLILTGITGFSQPGELAREDYEMVPNHRKPDAPVARLQSGFEPTLVNAFKSGDSEKIAQFFNDNVDLSIGDAENLYSSSQAEQILKNFFIKNKPSDFEIVHKGKSGVSEYFIGQLKTSTGDFRVTINGKKVNGRKVISSLAIEED